jgi:hypothetical protein
MNRPGAFTWVLGSPSGCIVTVGFAGYMVVGLMAAPSGAHLLLTFISMLPCSAAFKARAQVKSYRHWKREWEAMSGAGPELDERRRKTKKRSEILAGIVCWFATLAYFVASPSGSSPVLTGFLGLVFLGCTLAGLGWFFTRAGRAIRRIGSTAKRQGDDGENTVVTVCLPVPSQPLRRKPITADLPDYCQALLAKSHGGHS